LEPRRILVTGGAGYIGAHTVALLLRKGYDVTVVDNLSRGYRHNVDAARLVELPLSDTAALKRLMSERRFDAVIHFAAFIAVGESVKVPELYFENNTCGSLSLLNAMIATGVRAIVFSSTAAVYGLPERVPIVEETPYAPINPYGESKAMVETMLAWFDRIHGLRSISLRYFNAAGADPEGRIGEEHDPETHLIPLVLRAVQTGKPVKVFGNDYATEDGTCIRDYVHVNDLAEAHILAVEWLLGGGESQVFNAGTGSGNSVMEVIRAAEAVTGKTAPFEIAPRREGDPALLVASCDKLRRVLAWSPRFTDLREIVETAWNFERQRSR
jgi:UDP-glucose-4-epimerase GalE